jgi:hypothetical protein
MRARFARAPWLALGAVGSACAISTSPMLVRRLAFERTAIAGGEFWRLATGHLVDPWLALAVFDLATLGVLAVWLELRSRALCAATLALSAAAASAVIWFARPDLERYVGSSALGCGALAALGVDHALRGGSRLARAIGVTALALLAAKLIADVTGYGAIAALPHGVELAASAHVAGAIAGAACAAIACALRRRTR